MIVAIVSILGALLLGAMSPGPSFVLVARTAAAASRLDGIAAAFGMGAGGIIFGGFALYGLQLLFTHANAFYMAFKMLGGVYLLYLAYRLWRGALQPVSDVVAEDGSIRDLRRSFLFAFGTQLSNPKTVVVYGSIFAALLPSVLPTWTPIVLLPLIFVVEFGWYSVVAVIFSTGPARTLYLRSKYVVDRVAASVLAVLGLKLIY